MPLSTPVTVEAMVTATATAMSATCTAVPVGTSKSAWSPKLMNTTPMPSEVAMPKIVPMTAAISTPWPMEPSMRRPKIGASAERMDSGMW